MKKSLLIILISFYVQYTHAEIYQCTDDKGIIIFKDSECAATENLIIKKQPRSQVNISAPEIKTETYFGQNLVKNSNFDNKLLDWRVPLGMLWTSNGGKNGGAGLLVHAAKPPKDRYIHETTASQCVLLTDASKFEVSADVRLQGLPKKNVANRVNIIWYESTNCSTGGQWGSYLEPKLIEGWQHLVRKNLTPALGAQAVKITVTQNGRYSNDGKAYWDNIRFYPSEMFRQSSPVTTNASAANNKYTLQAGENYIKNGDFKKDISVWQSGLKVEWSYSQGDRFPGAAKVIMYSNSGSKGQNALLQCVNLGVNKKFILTASFKHGEISNQLGSGRLRINWYDGQNCSGRSKTDTNWVDPEYIGGWQKLRITDLHAPAKSQSASIEIIQSIRGAGRFIAYWDDIYFAATE